jgi:hypothetical protein
LIPEELAKVICEMARDPEVVEMLKRFSGVGPASFALRNRNRMRHAHEIRRETGSRVSLQVSESGTEELFVRVS